MVAEYYTQRLRLSQQPTCHEVGRSYADLMSKKKASDDKAEASRDAFAVEFGKRLRAAREAKQMTGTALGSQLGATKTNVSQWENGTHMPDLKTLAALCDALTCSADALLGRAFTDLSAGALEEARAFDSLERDDQRKWRTLRLTMFTPA